MRRKQRSLAHIYETRHWQRSPEMARQDISCPESRRKSVGFSDHIGMSDNGDTIQNNHVLSGNLLNMGENTTGNCHKPLAKCIQNPLAQTHQAKTDLILLNRLNQRTGYQAGNARRHSTTNIQERNTFVGDNETTMPSIVISDSSLQNNSELPIVKEPYQKEPIPNKGQNQENVCDMKPGNLEMKAPLGNTLNSSTKYGLGRFDRRSSFTLVLGDKASCPHSEL